METDQIGIAKNRSRREKPTKSKNATLERLKESRKTGEKYKPELVNEKNIYEEVDENEYSKIVKKRQDDNWIVDDYGDYIEDGREIFDDDLYGKHQDSASKKKKKKNSTSSASFSSLKDGTPTSSRNIKSMFAAFKSTSKPKETQETKEEMDDPELMQLIEDVRGGAREKKMATQNSEEEEDEIEDGENFFIMEKEISPEIKPLKVIDLKRNSRIISKTIQKKKEEQKDKNLFTKNEEKNKNEKNFIEEKEKKIEKEILNNNKKNNNENDNKNNNIINNHDDDDNDMGGFDFEGEMNVEMEEKMEEDDVSSSEEKEEEDLFISNTKEINTSTFAPPPPSSGDDLHFYWLDAHEDRFRHPGVVFLFGKIYDESEMKHETCCLVVKEILRTIFLLPRKNKLSDGSPVTLKDVYDEFNNLSTKLQIMNFRSKKSRKFYAFEKVDVPYETDYLEVQYNASQAQLPVDHHGDTFSHIFGSNTSSLEMLIVQCNLKGPSWLKVKNPVVNNFKFSWCSKEFTILGLGSIEEVEETLDPPPLVTMSLNIQTYTNPFSGEVQIISLSYLASTNSQINKSAKKPKFNQSFCALAKPPKCDFPFDLKQKIKSKSQLRQVAMELVWNERSLLSLFLTKFSKLDPDIIVGHDILSFDLPLLWHRLHLLKVPQWSKLGRICRKEFLNKQQLKLQNCTGRLVCDVSVSAKELISSRSYDLSQLTFQVLKVKRVPFPEITDLSALFCSSSQLCNLLLTATTDASLVFRLLSELDVLPLALQITQICGNLMSRTLLGGRAERNEYLLLHAFHSNNFILPDKIYKKNQNEDEQGENGKRKKASYAGGLVLEPKKGFYESFVLLLDFNSLYPSIIQEFNICFTTVAFSQTIQEKSSINKKSTSSSTGESDYFYDESLIPERGLQDGVLPTEIRKLVESRKQVKCLMKGVEPNSDLYCQYNIRQKALKLTANSMYGCLGFSSSRFFACRLAALITGKGREILLKTKELVESLNIEVIYGDTDSIMVNTRLNDYQDAILMGKKIKNEVNKHYNKLEIDIDGIYRPLLLLKKKKYAAMSCNIDLHGKIQWKREMKGLDIVRRDWCSLSKQVGESVLDDLFSGDSTDGVLEKIQSKLKQVSDDIKEGRVKSELFHISKQLARNPEDYNDKENLPHVTVAKRLNTSLTKKFKSGDVIYYVVCTDNTNNPPMKRVYHPDELIQNSQLAIDAKYYLIQQIHPVVSRLLEPIDGADSSCVAHWLGLDPNQYKTKTEVTSNFQDGGLDYYESRFQNCLNFSVNCVSCGIQNEIINPYLKSGKDLSLKKCSSCDHCLLDNPNLLGNRLTSLIRGFISKYYEGWLLCEECSHRTNQVPLSSKGRGQKCPFCQKGKLKFEYTPESLYNQLLFFQKIFDTRTSSSQTPSSLQHLEVMEKLRNIVDKYLNKSAFNFINLNTIFKELIF